jgi:hypothetical protein
MGFVFKASCAALAVAWLAAPTPPAHLQSRTFSNSMLVVGGKCVDLSSASSSSSPIGNPAYVQINDCHGASSQRWTMRVDGTIHSAVSFNKCLGLPAKSSENGAAISLYDCTGQVDQDWSYEDNNTIQSLSGRCLDLHAGSLTNQTRIELFDCHGRWNQQFVALP